LSHSSRVPRRRVLVDLAVLGATSLVPDSSVASQMQAGVPVIPHRIDTPHRMASPAFIVEITDFSPPRRRHDAVDYQPLQGSSAARAQWTDTQTAEVYYDTAMAFSRCTLAALTKLVPKSHVLFGTDFLFCWGRSCRPGTERLWIRRERPAGHRVREAISSAETSVSAISQTRTPEVRNSRHVEMGSSVAESRESGHKSSAGVWGVLLRNPIL
jgi:hypothetical protein